MIKKICDKSFSFWREIINFWTVFFMAAIIYDFICGNTLNEIMGALSAVYIGVLAIYVGNKEFERWNNVHKGRHPGEIFVFIWTFLIFSLLTLDIVLERAYVMPPSVVSAYLAVLTILAVTSKSKSMHQRKKTS